MPPDAQILIRPSRTHASLVNQTLPIAATTAVQVWGVYRLVQEISRGDVLSALEVIVLITLTAAYLAQRWLYFRNVSLYVRDDRIGFTTRLGRREEILRSRISRLSILAGETGGFASPMMSPRVILRNDADRCIARVRVSHFAENDLREFCDAVGAPADGPDGVWVA
jgi:hypothetical protein